VKGGGLWERVGDGFRIHDYHHYQPTREDAERTSALRAAAGRRGGQRSGESRRLAPEANGTANTKHVASLLRNPVPIPSRPVPERDESCAAAPPAPALTTEHANGAHARVLATFVEEYSKVRGVAPTIGPREGKAAKELLRVAGSADVASAIVRRAFADPFVATKKPSLAFIASNSNDFRGSVKPSHGPSPSTARRPPLQPYSEPRLRDGASRHEDIKPLSNAEIEASIFDDAATGRAR
jgi:hypothetical protein